MFDLWRSFKRESCGGKGVLNLLTFSSEEIFVRHSLVKFKIQIIK